MIAEQAAGGELAIVAARAWADWELAAFAWLALTFVGTVALLTVAALTGHQAEHPARAAIGAAALSCFYLTLCLLRPGQVGLGDRDAVRPAAIV